MDKLSKQLRSLSTLALRVISTQPLSAASRHTAPFVPLPHPLAGAAAAAAGQGRLPRCLEPLDVLLQLESSGQLTAYRVPPRHLPAAHDCLLMSCCAYGAAAG